MGSKNNPGSYDCYENAEPDEPMFVLLARDPEAPALIRRWAKMREAHGEPDNLKIIEAIECAEDMVLWRKEREARQQREAVVARRAEQRKAAEAVETKQQMQKNQT